MKHIIFSFVLSIAMFLPGFASAEALPPEAIAKATSEDLLATVRERSAELEADPEKIYELVEETLVPLIDTRYVTQLVLARNWRKASESQQLRFQEAFKNVLIRTYSKALLAYTDEKIEWQPVTAKEGAKKIKVHSEILPKDGPSVPITYSFRLKDGEWKVYDVAVEGISLVQNYRGQMAAEIKADGLEATIKRLEEKAALAGK